MSYFYSERDIQGMIAAGIISDPNREPDMKDVLFIEKQHKCKECGGDVKYRRKKDGGVRDYHFICKICGYTDDDAPLKKGK